MKTEMRGLVERWRKESDVLISSECFSDYEGGYSDGRLDAATELESLLEQEALGGK